MNLNVLQGIYDCILEISSKEIQVQLWLGKSENYCSSYAEVMCSLYDDFKFDNFVNLKVAEIGFSDETQEKFKYFENLLKSYNEYNKTDYQIINDTKWQYIGEIADDLLENWKRDEDNNCLKYHASKNSFNLNK